MSLTESVGLPRPNTPVAVSGSNCNGARAVLVTQFPCSSFSIVVFS